MQIIILLRGDFMKNSCEFVTLITLLACDIAQGKSQEELAILSAVFTQFGDTLATLSAFK